MRPVDIKRIMAAILLNSIGFTQHEEAASKAEELYNSFPEPKAKPKRAPTPTKGAVVGRYKFK